MMGRQSRQMAMLFVDIESLIPETHLLRKIERMVSFDFIYDIFPQTVDAINKQGGIHLDGSAKNSGFGKILFASTDMEKVISNASVILVVLPSIYHNSIAQKIAPLLKDGQIVILNLITPLGTIDFQNTLTQSGCTADIVLAGTNTLLFACRAVQPGHVHVSGQKKDILISAYPSRKNSVVLAAIQRYLPEYRMAPDILMVSLDNLNFEFHPGPTLLYTAMIENGIDFEYYSDFTPSQARLIEAIDQERLDLCRAYGVKVRDVAQTFHDEYGYEGTLYEMIKHADVYKGIKGPSALNSRFLTEDIPYSLRAIQTLAQIANIPTPAIDTVMNLDLIRYQQLKELGVVHSAKEFIQLFHPDEQEDTP